MKRLFDSLRRNLTVSYLWRIVYDHFGLLSQKTILAHCVHLEEHEMDLIQQRGAGISHCPTSNLNLRSGNSPVAVLLDRNIKVGLGTDVSGGFGHGILSALREASVVSKVLSFTQEKKTEKDKSRGRSETPKGGLPVIEGDKHLAAASEVSETEMFTGKHLPLETLFFLATLGGAEVCDLQDRIGNFVVGKEFDAILVRTGQANPDDEGDVFFSQPNPAMFVEPEDTLPVLFERFLFTGDYANVSSQHGERYRIADPVRCPDRQCLCARPNDWRCCPAKVELTVETHIRSALEARCSNAEGSLIRYAVFCRCVQLGVRSVLLQYARSVCCSLNGWRQSRQGTTAPYAAL